MWYLFRIIVKVGIIKKSNLWSLGKYIDNTLNMLLCASILDLLKVLIFHVLNINLIVEEMEKKARKFMGQGSESR